MKKLKNICIVTGTRAEYGLLKPVIEKVTSDMELNLQLVVTGMHLSSEFGNTIKDIEVDGFNINKKVEMLLASDSPVAIAKSVGLGTISFSEVFSTLKPDIVIILGDRYEIFAAAQTAMIMRIPIAHIHGGELTQGLIDDPIRHSITKMAQIHFVSEAPYQKRVIQLGERPENVHLVGSLGIENISKVKLLSKKQLSTKLNMCLDKYFLITVHPTTLVEGKSEQDITVLLQALENYNDYGLLFTKSNSDTEGRIINEKIIEFIERYPNARLFDSLGLLNYLSAMYHSEAVIGNSSSGIIETPGYGTPTLNLGNRQNGRYMRANIITKEFELNEIHDGIKIVTSKEFKNLAKQVKNAFEEQRTSEQIVNHIKRYLNEFETVEKTFYDLRDSN